MKRILPGFRIFFAVFVFNLVSMVAFGYDAVVAKDGSGNYTTVKAAIAAAPTGRVAPWTIYIKNGVYYEKDTVPSNKPFLQLIGESVSGTIITFDAGASSPAPGGGTYGTLGSATFSINAPDFSAMNITFVNSYGDGSQAVAVAASGDRATFCNCRFLGNQDTLYTRGSGTPKQYFRNCYIDGNVDFIFGNAIAVFDSCVIYAKTRTSAGSSYITAANTPQGQAYGYVFRNCMLPANRGLTTYYLGRPWQNSTGSAVPFANNKTVFINAKMSTSIRPEGWSVWDAGTQTDLITYAEYVSNYFNGTPVDVSQRVSWSKQLTLPELLPYDLATIFSGWDPLAILGGACNSNPGLTVSNLRGVKGASNSDLTWNASWPINDVLYELFRSADGAAYSVISSVTSSNDSSINFGSTDVIPPPGSIYKYYVVASKVGYTSASSDTISISSAPTLQVTGGLGSFIQGLGAPSATQSYTLSGFNLLGNVTVTPPENFEVSSDDGANWFTNASPLVINPGGAVLAATTIKVRLNATILGDWAGSVINSTTGPGNVPVPVVLSGKTLAQLPDAAGVLQWWPMSANNLDSAAVRNVGVVASVPTLNKFYLSTNATYPPYSAARGQAFGASSDGAGMWTTASGGPGGNLNRTFYEQFTITAAPGKTVRVDSIILGTSFLSTSSNTKLAVVYSKSGFVSDSADVTGGVGPSGTLAGTANGAFATPILVAQNNNGPSDPGNTYRLALNGGTGVSISEGETVSLRLYYSCGSTSAARYAFLKNVIVNGTSKNTEAQVLQHWPMNVDNADSALVRSDAVTASTSTLNKLYVSNGTTNANYQPYSATFGQSFGASADGSGQWAVGVGGPGGNLNRTYYEQFTVTAVAGKGVKVDSLILSSAFLLTTSNIKLAAVYSKSGFVSDSADVTGGYGPGGLLPDNAHGGFTTPIILTRQDNGPTDTYRLALNAENGVTVVDGETLTIRLYYSCGSTGVPRYAFLKNVMVKGFKVSPSLPVKLLSFNAGLAGSKANLWWKTSNEMQLSHFEIERSSDVRLFGKVGNVQAFNSNTANAYAFQDDLSAEIANGKKIAYYRLKLVDQDGKYSYSQVIPVMLAGKSGRLLLYPNPVQDRVVVIHEKAATQASILILAADGKQLSQSIPAKDAEQTIISTGMLPAGVYTLVFENAGVRSFSKFVKQ